MLMNQALDVSLIHSRLGWENRKRHRGKAEKELVTSTVIEVWLSYGDALGLFGQSDLCLMFYYAAGPKTYQSWRGLFS